MATEAPTQQLPLLYTSLEPLNSNVHRNMKIRAIEKAAVIARLQIGVFFDDMDEVIGPIPESVKVFKVRNAGNFDFPARKWLYNRHTGRQL